MSETWNPKEHDIRMEEKTDASLTYQAQIICDGKSVYHMEKPVSGRFSIMKVHNAFLEIVEQYEKTGELPSRASRFLKKTR